MKSFLNNQGKFAHVNVVWRSLTQPKLEFTGLVLVISKLNTMDRLNRLNIRHGLHTTCMLLLI